jgi:PPOX class probable F420-dependent enzyme
MPLDDDTIRLAQGKNLATVVTLMPDGHPQAQLTWVDTDGEHVLVNTEPQRQKARNVARDPRITVLIHSADDPTDWSEVRGHVTETVGGDEARGTSTTCPGSTWIPNSPDLSAHGAG